MRTIIFTIVLALVALSGCDNSVHQENVVFPQNPVLPQGVLDSDGRKQDMEGSDTHESESSRNGALETAAQTMRNRGFDPTKPMSDKDFMKILE